MVSEITTSNSKLLAILFSMLTSPLHCITQSSWSIYQFIVYMKTSCGEC